MQVKVNNVRIKDIIALLAKMHYYCEAVDITLDDKEKRVMINPTEENDSPPDDPNKTRIKDNDLGDII